MTIPELRNKIEKLKKLDGGGFFRAPKYQVFGSATHKYNFNSCLSNEEINEFEITKRTILPREYRSFINLIGNGGCGPAYGLFRLSNWDFELDINDPQFLSIEFPHVEKWNIKNEANEDDDNYFETEEFQNWEKEYYSDKHITGSMRICHYGCAIYYLLIVSGHEAGKIWVDDRASDNGIYPAMSNKSGEKMTFIDWYNEWLTESIDNYI